MNEQQESRLINLIRNTPLPEREKVTNRISLYNVTMKLRLGEVIQKEIWAASSEDAVFAVYRSRFSGPIEVIYHMDNRVYEVKSGGAWGADAYVDRRIVELYETGWVK